MNNVSEISKLLNLHAFKILGIDYQDKETLIRVELKKSFVNCPVCGHGSKKPHQYNHPRKILCDIWGKRKIFLIGNKKRWRCKHCRKPFSEVWPGLANMSRKMDQAKLQILNMLKGQSFNNLAEMTGIKSYESRYLLKQFKIPVDWKEEEKCDAFKLGIDEHSFSGREMATTITDLSAHKPKTILPDDRIISLVSFLNNIPEHIKGKISEVCVDMKAGFVSAVEKTLPHASIVIDHFHVIQDANRRLDEARRIEQEGYRRRIHKTDFLLGAERLNSRNKQNLQGYFVKYPLLKEWYWAKEQLRSVYSSQDKDEATKRLKSLISTLLEHDDAAMNDWGRTLRCWQAYILNYFNSRTTNAYTEGIHTKFKLIKRMSYGFRNIDIYIKKVLLAFMPFAVLSAYFFHTIC
jgi:transposase